MHGAIKKQLQNAFVVKSARPKPKQREGKIEREREIERAKILEGKAYKNYSQQLSKSLLAELSLIFNLLQLLILMRAN